MSPKRLSRHRPRAGLILGALVLAACSGGGGGGDAGAPPADAARKRILFVGNSFTHGRYTPVREYNAGGREGQASGSALVVDENEGASGPRAEDKEPGPYGGIAGLFAEFAVEAGLDYEVHIEAISSATLQGHYRNAGDVIVDPKWDAVVLQEQSSRPLPPALSGTDSDPAAFCAGVKSIEQALHGVAPEATVYLYETWPRADQARSLAGDPDAPGFAAAYADALRRLGDAYHDAYYRAAALDGAITAVVPAGDAWTRAWADGVADPDPYRVGGSGPSLWYGIHAVNDPAISAPDYYHPSVHGAYLAALVLFQQITGVDARTLGAGEEAAAALGIDAATAVKFQQIAAATVLGADPAPVEPGVDSCAP